jgi:ribosomal protein S18 acetylase RimI-like enzyme
MHAMLQESLRAALRGRGDVESVGPFLASFDPDSDSPFRNYAVPARDARPTREEVEDLRRAFVRRERLPRLEFLPAAAPTVEAALIRAGFVTEARLPIMTCWPAGLCEAPPPAGVAMHVAVDDEELRQAAEVQNVAYGAPRATNADVVRLRGEVAAGGIVGLARHVDGRAIGSGLVAAPSAGFAELAAVGVLTGWRRRGVAAALTSALGRAAFDRGVAALMLMAYEAEQGIYARAGFTVASEIIFISAGSSKRSPSGSGL